ncbi:hypothetical protein BT63DRAFT_411670 [Microthyrium microscopicum]|uniref:Uncharacterized protein n=1 Tax=Microthyrium microscopicum TaxID=703497 RepID=A0A6A6ULR7_9PEZI|nr:hypothetical protein BT63DRAFT_411670 [Microthyrium microscopicum]
MAPNLKGLESSRYAPTTLTPPPTQAQPSSVAAHTTSPKLPVANEAPQIPLASKPTYVAASKDATTTPPAETVQAFVEPASKTPKGPQPKGPEPSLYASKPGLEASRYAPKPKAPVASQNAPKPKTPVASQHAPKPADLATPLYDSKPGLEASRYAPKPKAPVASQHAPKPPKPTGLAPSRHTQATKPAAPQQAPAVAAPPVTAKRVNGLEFSRFAGPATVPTSSTKGARSSNAARGNVRSQVAEAKHDLVEKPICLGCPTHCGQK